MKQCSWVIVTPSNHQGEVRIVPFSQQLEQHWQEQQVDQQLNKMGRLLQFCHRIKNFTPVRLWERRLRDSCSPNKNWNKYKLVYLHCGVCVLTHMYLYMHFCGCVYIHVHMSIMYVRITITKNANCYTGILYEQMVVFLWSKARLSVW